MLHVFQLVTVHSDARVHNMNMYEVLDKAVTFPEVIRLNSSVILLTMLCISHGC